ncbi:hypothetical protein AVEN_14553-1 [Araneus ventricosus]|uniref:Reverse transcriptase domain-containing protein n=1 Tax=Araneus ventricosus TaxID=182803 RepID=A0A4Y2CF49_ARAVE|nr:hypothetical protein AVEN_14553-1 [Araneus ventricosus]
MPPKEAGNHQTPILVDSRSSHHEEESGSLQEEGAESGKRHAMFTQEKERNSTASSQPNDSPFSSRELRKVKRELNKTKAPGYVGLDNITLQQIHSASPELLLEMFNKCLSLGLFLTSFKTGVILLLYKEGKDQNDTKSYRPISLLPSMGKLLEKLMTQRLTHFLKKTRQLSPKQFGFKEGVSIAHALDSLLTTIDSHKKCMSP